MRYLLPLALLFATPAFAQQAPTLAQQLDSMATSINTDVVGMRNLILTQDASIRQLTEANAALTKKVAELTPAAVKPAGSKP